MSTRNGIVFMSSNWTVFTSSPVSALVQRTLQSLVTDTTKFLYSATPRFAAVNISALLLPGSISHVILAVVGITHINSVYGAISVNDIHETIIDQRRALVAAQLE